MSLEAVDQKIIVDLARTYFGIEASVEPLASYAGHNFLLSEHVTDAKYVLKISEPSESFWGLQAQNAIMHHLEGKDLPFLTPRPVQGINNQEIIELPGHDGEYYIRVLSFLPGTLLGDLSVHSNQLLEQWGQCLAKIDDALMDFKHEGFSSEHPWNFESIPKQISKHTYCKDPSLKKIVLYFFSEYIKNIQPIIEKMKKYVIHNDGNDFNLIVDRNNEKGGIKGIIDFGDAVYSCHICELAIACTYAMLDKQDPLSALKSVVKGYHRQLPLTIHELELLPTLIGARLALSISLSAYEYHKNPKNDYLLASQNGAKNLINILISISPQSIVNTLCKECDIRTNNAIDTQEEYEGYQSLFKH